MQFNLNIESIFKEVSKNKIISEYFIISSIIWKIRLDSKFIYNSNFLFTNYKLLYLFSKLFQKPMWDSLDWSSFYFL